MARNRLAMALGAAVLIPALVLTGCGGKKKSNDTSTQPTQASNAQATRPAGSTAAPTTAASGGGGGNVSGNELAALLANFLKAKSYKMALQDGSGKSQGTFEYVAPDKYHIVSGDLELISIGSDSYVKQSGTWIKLPTAAAGSGAINTMDLLKAQLDTVSKLTGTKGGTDSVNGVSCQIYNVTEPDGTKSELCVANGLPLRIKSTNAIILISDYDKVPDIKAPI